MHITLTTETCQALPAEEMAKLGWSQDKGRWKAGHSVDLSNLTRTQLDRLQKLLQPHTGIRTVPARLYDIETYMRIVDSGGKTRCRHIKTAEPMLKQYLKPAPNHWVYRRRGEGLPWQPFYVSRITYHPPKEDRWGNQTEPYVELDLLWEEMGEVEKTSISLFREDTVDLTPELMLANKGYFVETPEMLAEYEANRKYYLKIHDKVGLQFLASGEATDDLDSWDKKERDSWWGRGVKTYALGRDGEPARVVVDVLHETDKKESNRDAKPNSSYWGDEAVDLKGDEADDERDIKPGDEDENQEQEVVPYKIPLQPAVPCFDLRKQVRLRIYVDQLTPYRYDRQLSEKLILPAEVRGLVDLLVAHRGGFKDIVGGKGVGSIILCAGPPGTGKTLTSEVYSEAMERPLYSVQCSQLGTDADELEKNLMKVFARAVRWNAILLLDECDVYVAARGSDLTQNAIVGVFLRVLEYYRGVMFLTTNRADLVDDAVASRCLARIDYAVPPAADQARIWRTLAEGADIPISEAVIKKAVDTFPGLSGRDVKNLLKLAAMVSTARDEPISLETIRYVKKFKPTQDPSPR